MWKGVLSAVGRVSVSEIKQEMESISFAYWQKRPSVLSCEDMLHLSGGMKLAFSEPDAFEWPLSRSARIASEKSEELRSTCFSEDLHTDNTNEESQWLRIISLQGDDLLEWSTRVVPRGSKWLNLSSLNIMTRSGSRGDPAVCIYRGMYLECSLVRCIH